ncbi:MULTISPECIES: aminotransferase class I/II-fold pyridoxal phosphate-dependent enzyme [unclassified Microbacterium]|uniref:aminotransferase class I/II-fold pyridoxal phosphate-dependent enzyme n=1 Tax=unclassified Microbacterium TaxID=2609290 RepID=UPI00068E9DB7|nr:MULTISPECIES: aminotransferase class I/II-fold pyridoxal phosphate-dependent enzyme [unclassified Microbacterium]MCV0334021.1 aminotransferase class I/II-fold pyridoxal phosphate-dependent enzyme [Microbacterium sp.]MCV0374451.1 aminotransferase class I/II-fold pyridoxal phosphate-dependent enzyme [Microbacterium sp.]MCV0389523.1 aminotransferase class I/II-fold pyridoxal phosphate-dependent enzyme [Microbacterium sp.]MCV0419057.1 aminotransferase class I/II-fold pyridoxal phosphate-dependen
MAQAPDREDVEDGIVGSTAAEISESVRDLVERGAYAPGDQLPSVRSLAARLGVNRNTVLAAYRSLVTARIAATGGRTGTTVLGPAQNPDEGFTPGSVLRDLGSGNPDPAHLPDLAAAFAAVTPGHVLYGESVIDADLAEWATEWIAADHPRPFRLSITAGAVDAVERLLAQTLVQGDRVGLEDPCFLSSIHTARLAGYVPVTIPVDREGMTVAGLRAALESGARAIVCTPRAHNPTGVGTSPARARELREVLADHPHVLVIEDDHFSMLAPTPYESIIAPTQQRWALVRSVSKFLGPDMRLAVTASDRVTAQRLALRLSPGTMWVSHVMQRLAATMLRDDETRELIIEAGAHYAGRNRLFVSMLVEQGMHAQADSGLNVWVDVRDDATEISRRLASRGWLVRPGSEFALDPGSSQGSTQLRLTVHTLDDAEMQRLVDDLVGVAGGSSAAGVEA